MPDPHTPHDTPEQPSWDEAELLMGLSPGDELVAGDKRSGQRWRGIVDVVAPGQGKLWMYVELGERKMIDTEIHQINRPT